MHGDCHELKVPNHWNSHSHLCWKPHTWSPASATCQGISSQRWTSQSESASLRSNLEQRRMQGKKTRTYSHTEWNGENQRGIEKKQKWKTDVAQQCKKSNSGTTKTYPLFHSGRWRQWCWLGFSPSAARSLDDQRLTWPGFAPPTATPKLWELCSHLPLHWHPEGY